MVNHVFENFPSFVLNTPCFLELAQLREMPKGIAPFSHMEAEFFRYINLFEVSKYTPKWLQKEKKQKKNHLHFLPGQEDREDDLRNRLHPNLSSQEWHLMNLKMGKLIFIYQLIHEAFRSALSIPDVGKFSFLFFKVKKKNLFSFLAERRLSGSSGFKPLPADPLTGGMWNSEQLVSCFP